jgi:hypothetical protein
VVDRVRQRAVSGFVGVEGRGVECVILDGMDWSVRANREWYVVLIAIAVLTVWVRMADGGDAPPAEFEPLLAAMEQCREDRRAGIDTDRREADPFTQEGMAALIEQSECEESACSRMRELCADFERWRERRAEERESERQEREFQRDVY